MPGGPKRVVELAPARPNRSHQVTDRESSDYEESDARKPKRDQRHLLDLGVEAGILPNDEGQAAGLAKRPSNEGQQSEAHPEALPGHD